MIKVVFLIHTFPSQDEANGIKDSSKDAAIKLYYKSYILLFAISQQYGVVNYTNT